MYRRGGERLWWRRFENSPLTLAEVVTEAGAAPEVVIEATWGWYWVADVVAEAGGRVHLAHPLGIKGFENRPEERLADGTVLADLLRMGRLRRGSTVLPGRSLATRWDSAERLRS